MTDHRVMLVSGDMLDPFDPDLDMLTIDVIAHHLSMQCRFNGACSRFYSVAEHSINGARIADRADRDTARAFLLHDAHEAIIGDVVTPLKPLLADSPWWHAADALDLAIQDRFDVSFDNPSIKEIDNHMLAIEWHALMPDPDRYEHLRSGCLGSDMVDHDVKGVREYFNTVAERLGLS